MWCIQDCLLSWFVWQLVLPGFRCKVHQPYLLVTCHALSTILCICFWSLVEHVPPSPATNIPLPTFAQNYCGSYNTLSAKNLPSFPVNYGSPLIFTVSHPSDCSHSSHCSVFWLFKLNKHITTCCGCRNKFTNVADGGLPILLFDLILKCNEGRQRLILCKKKKIAKLIIIQV